MIRMANSVSITDNIFDGNKAVFTGKFNFGAAISMHYLFGLADISIKNS